MAEEQNKTEKPTPEKLRDAKEKGQVSKSQELNLVITCIVFLMVVMVFFESVGSDFVLLIKKLLSTSHNFVLNKNSVVMLFSYSAYELVMIFIPLVFFLMVFGVVINMMQVGFIFSSHSIKPDFKKINPASGLKKIFSIKTIFEFFKSVIKLAAIGITLYLCQDYFINVGKELMETPIEEIPYVWLSLFLNVGLFFIIMCIPFVLVDFYFNKWDFTKKMMMSRRDVKDEHKKREGDPEVRSKQKQIQKDLLQKSAALSQVKDSDVVILNPTHIAIALKYDKDSMVAPIVVAAGKGELALKIRKQARKYSIPMIQNKSLARRLYKETRINGAVPANCFNELAPVFKWLLGIK
jgi:flagellar biosynthetic protein FlhB